jgi:hypothetical protein
MTGHLLVSFKMLLLSTKLLVHNLIFSYFRRFLAVVNLSISSTLMKQQHETV